MVLSLLKSIYVTLFYLTLSCAVMAQEYEINQESVEELVDDLTESNLIDEDEVTEYEVYPSPTRSAIFDPGQTSRINVGHFMAELITDNDIWQRWKRQMPVIYNKSE